MNQPVRVTHPDFSAIDITTLEADLDRHLDACREAVKRVEQQADPSWESLMQPQAEVHNALSLFWSPISHLNSVMNSDALREVHKRCLPKLSAYYTELGQNSHLYNTTLALRDGPRFTALTASQQKEIENDIREFELGGVSLDARDKKRFGEIAESLSRLGTEFSDNVLDASRAWEYHIESVDELDGLPESAVAAARQRAEGKGRAGWLLNLEAPTYLAVMTFANRRDLRERLYTAWSTRASDQGPHAGQFDNSARMREILLLRAEKAALLGYDNYAELSMVRKMVDSPAEVQNFLDDLAERAVPKAKAELDELAEFAREELGIETLAAWDIAWASDRLKKVRHALSDEDLKPYFPADRVIPGMFEVIARLFKLSIEPVSGVDVYHPDVACYRIHDRQGEHRGDFYLDTYARENKRGGAWMDVCASRQLVDGAIQLPIAYLTCNLTPPVGDDPALLTHDEVTTLFHEFGHGLHHMLTRVNNAGVSGINGVEWDAVELPSQFLENWCWERESLDLISGHFQSGSPLPDELLDRLRGARHFQSGMQLVRQLEFSLFDLAIHQGSTPGSAADLQATLDAVRARVAVAPIPEFNRFQHSFAHVFAGGYAAGYFSYKWAEVLSADAFERFADEGIFDDRAGQDFLEEILEVGGSRDAMVSYVAFRGRKPTTDALLRQSGLAA